MKRKSSPKKETTKAVSPKKQSNKKTVKGKKDVKSKASKKNKPESVSSFLHRCSMPIPSSRISFQTKKTVLTYTPSFLIAQHLTIWTRLTSICAL